MDAEIRPNLPQGSPFLAYGQARGPFSGKGSAFLIAGIVAGICAAILLFILFIWRIPFPAGDTLLATIGSGPRYGYVLEQNQVSRFSLTLFGQMNEPERARSGLVKLGAENNIALTTIRGVDLLPFFFARLTGKGYAIARLKDGTLVQGSIADHTWSTDMKIQTSSVDLPHTELAIDLVAFPDAWSDLATALEPLGLVMEKVAPPDTFGFTQASDTHPNIIFGYADGVPPSTRLAVAAFAGLADARATALPDGEVVDELFLPENLLKDSSSTAVAASGTGFVVTDTTVGQMLGPEVPSQPCGNRTTFLLTGKALETLQTAWNISEARIRAIGAGEKDGKLLVCLIE